MRPRTCCGGGPLRPLSGGHVVAGELAVKAVEFEVAAVKVKFCDVVESHGSSSVCEVDAKSEAGGNCEGKG